MNIYQKINRILRTEKKLPVRVLKGEGYQYFIYDDGRYHSISEGVYQYRITEKDVDTFVAEGVEFGLKTQEKILNGNVKRFNFRVYT
jgi:hypothetical protein